MEVPSPGSRSKTMRSGGVGNLRRRPMCHKGTWNSMVPRLAAHASVGRSLATAYSMSPRRSLDGTVTVRTHAGRMRRDVLLEEGLPLHAVGKPLHGQRPVTDVRQHDVRHPDVVVDELSFGEARPGEQHFLEVGDRELAAPDRRPRGGFRDRPPSSWPSCFGRPPSRPLSLPYHYLPTRTNPPLAARCLAP